MYICSAQAKVVFYNIMYIDVHIIFDIRMHNKCITMSLWVCSLFPFGYALKAHQQNFNFNIQDSFTNIQIYLFLIR